MLKKKVQDAYKHNTLQSYYENDLLEKVKTLIRFDNAQAAVLTVEPVFGNIILARGSKAPWDSRTFRNSSPSPATFPNAHAHCSATGKELFSGKWGKMGQALSN